MFEPKTLLDRRVAVLESLFSQVLNTQVDRLQSADPLVSLVGTLIHGRDDVEILHRQLQAYMHRCEDERNFLKDLLERWAFMGHSYKDSEARRVVGETTLTDGTAATRGWIEPLIRANSGLLMCMGDGLHNPKSDLRGNNVDIFQTWLAGLESLDVAISDVRETSFLRDMVGGEAATFGGLPILFINAGDFLHLVAMTNRVIMQSISVRHLPVDWSWEVEGQWRIEVFSYLDNMSKSVFLRHYMHALKKEGASVFYLPDDIDQATRTVVEQAAEHAQMSIEDVKLELPQESNTDTTDSQVAANDEMVDDSPDSSADVP